MKIISNFKHIIFSLLTVSLAVACSPITDEYEDNSKAVTADELQLRVEPVVVNGAKTNKIVVENHSPIPSEWTLDRLGTTAVTSSRSCDTLTATMTGTNNVKFRGFNAMEGSFVEKTVPVDVDVISDVPDYIAQRLCIGQQGAPTTFSTDVDLNKIQIKVEKDANGLNGNRLTLINSNPVMTDWDFGGETSDKNIAELYVLNLGETPLKATFTLSDGRKVEHEFAPVDVQTYTYKPEFLVNLTGGDKGEQSWTWQTAPVKPYGLGGYGMSKMAEWYGFDMATLSGIGAAVGRGNEMTGATMTFKITGEVELSSGRKGTWSFDLSKNIPGWSIGKLYINDASVLYGFAFDQTTYIGREIHEYDIIQCSDGKMILCASNDGSNTVGGMATFFLFQTTE